MSNPILQSNQSSAVVATVNESQTMSPWVYNETNRLVVPHALQILPINHSAGTVAANKTITFDIAKNGLVQGLWLNLSLPSYALTDAAGVGTENLGAGENLTPDNIQSTSIATVNYTSLGLLKYIEEVRLTTSGRIVESLDRYQMLARIADMPYGQREATLAALRCNGNPEFHTTAATTPMTKDKLNEGKSRTWQGVIYLPFYFTQDCSRYSINSNFQEPFQVQVSFSDCKALLTGNDPGSTLAAHTPTACDLLVHYRQLDEKSINEVVSKNFGDGLLSQIVHISKKEALNVVKVSGTQQLDSTVSATVELKENDAIQAMYVMVETEHEYAAAETAQIGIGLLHGSPVECLEFELKFNNTSVMKVPGDFIRYFGRYGMHGMCGDGADKTDKLSPTRYVYKIDFGLDYAKGAFSNICALREISNPKLVVTFKPHNILTTANINYNVHVVYDTATFLSTSSATGRVNLSISS